MVLSAENIRFVLGLKLRNLRHARGFTLTEVAARSGLSVSYLSEIEKGKKYPKPDKLIKLAGVFDVPFDDLVSLRVDQELDTLKAAFSSPFLQEFPFELFGVEPNDLLDLVTDDPAKAGALIRTFSEIGRTYNLQVEHFLFAALRSYQALRGNYFEELEAAAAAYRQRQGWSPGEAIRPEWLRSLLEDGHGYRIDDTTLQQHPDLSAFRWVFVRGEHPCLFINGKLLPSQRAFILGYEIGYRHLDLPTRTFNASTWLKVESFEQVLNNFKASYFAGALLLDRDSLNRDLAGFLASLRWDSDALLKLMQRYSATPEMFFYRLTQLIPERFGLREIYFTRFNNDIGTNNYHLAKVLNMSRVPVPRGIDLHEHYCRRWRSLKSLQELATQQQRGEEQELLVQPQRAHFIAEDEEFLVLTIARRLALSDRVNSCVSLGFLIDDDLRRTIRFWDDAAIPRLDVNLSCERCGLSEQECQDREAPPTVFEQQQVQRRKEDALEAFIQTAR